MIARLDTNNNRSKKDFYDLLKSLDNDVYVVKINKDLPIATPNQWAYYRIALKIAALHTGRDVDNLEKFFEREYLSKVEYLENGKKIIVVASTSTLNTYEFGLYLEKVLHFIREDLGCIVPDAENFKQSQYQKIREDYQKMF